VLEKGIELRDVPYEQLRSHDEPGYEFWENDLRGTVSAFVEIEDDRVKVVVQGFREQFRWWRSLKMCSLDGFYKYPDGTVVDLEGEELYDYG
jgi:hypothetical protein